MRCRSASLLPLTEGTYRQPHRKQTQEMHLLDLESSLLFMDKCEPLIHSSLRTNWHLQPMQKYRSTQMPLFRGIARSGKRTPSHSQHCSGLLVVASILPGYRRITIEEIPRKRYTEAMSLSRTCLSFPFLYCRAPTGLPPFITPKLKKLSPVVNGPRFDSW